MKSAFLSLVIISCLSACTVQLMKADVGAPSDPTSDINYVLTGEQFCSYWTGGARTLKLKKGTRWKEVGGIKQGTIFQTDDQVVTLYDFDVHEAYIVVKDNYLEGFYLPVEKKFTPVLTRQMLILKPE